MIEMTPMSREMVGKLRALRRIQKISAQAMADRVTELGYSISRAQIANYETARKGTLPFDFVMVAAEALGSTIAELLAGPVRCPHCAGSPPAGFTCQTCGSDAAVTS